MQIAVRLLLNNLRRTWNTFRLVENYLRVICKLTLLKLLWRIMNQNDNNNDDEQEQREPVRPQQQQPPALDFLEQLNAAEPMDEGDDNDEDEFVVEEEDDDDDDDTIDSSDLDISMSTSTSYTDTEDEDNAERRRDRQHMRDFRFNIGNHAGHDDLYNIYTFKPMRLEKVRYKQFHARSSGYPIPRSGHRVIATDSHLYSLGGYNPKHALAAARRGASLLFQELWSYNFATRRWKLLLNGQSRQTMPRELASNALAIYNDVLISHGGTGYPFGESCSNDCYLYTTGHRSTVGALALRMDVTGEMPTAQYGPGIVVHEHYLYTIGGTTGFDYSCDVYRLNLQTKVWENVYICRPEMRDDPEGRYRHEVVYDGRHIYVLGGGTASSVYDLQTIPAFNLKTNKWDYIETLPDRSISETASAHQVVVAEEAGKGFPKPRKCFSCVQHTQSNGDIEAFIMGGLQGDTTTYFNDVWRLNLRTKEWTCIRTATLPHPLYFHSAAHAGNSCMYIFGGIEYRYKEMHRRNCLYSMWMTIPKLSEICWDALSYYNSKMDMFDRKTLLRAGVPEMFVNRVPH